MNQLKKSLLANQLINELEIYCTNRSCNWKGPLDNIKQHLSKCMYKSDKLPEWYLQYVKQQEEELQKEEEAQELLDETERDIQREQ